ncbi:MAG: penicillin acylase family protein [Isosphaeraceae bacterium]
MKFSRVLLITILFMGIVTISPALALAADGATTIYRDEFGIPHIFAPTIEDAAFASGYAQAEDRLEELLKNYRRANGTMAEVFGPGLFQEDLRQRVMRHAEISQKRYGEVSPKVRGIIAAYQNGIRQFMKEHPKEVPAWAREIHPWDVVALGRHIIWNWPMGEAAGDLEHAGLKFGDLGYHGSNEMLIGPGRTALHVPIAIVDPHVHWYDAIRFYELRVYTPEYNASGVTILGFPLPSLGHSRYCSVAMTTGGPDTSDIFEEEINPANPKQYRYDGGWRDFQAREITIAVKNKDKLEHRRVTIVSSHHGPIVARKDGKAYAMALPYENEVGLTDQFYQMFTARNLAEMKQALAHLQLMSQNIMVATVQGDIYYLRNGRVPIRPAGIDPGRPIRGNSSASEWKGIHPLADLLQIENPPCGWMQNCNCSPAAMMNRDQPDRSRFADHLYLYNESPSPNSHQRAEMVTDLLEGAPRVTVEQAIEIAFCTQVWHAERWQARIEEAWKHAATEDKVADAGRLFEQVRSWNRRSDPESRGALAYYAFKKALGGEAAKETEPPARLTDARILQALREGAAGLKSRFGEVEVPFGRYFRVGRRGGDRTWPVGGGSLHDEGMATPRAISFAPSKDGKEQVGHTGQSSTQIVIMTDPPESYAVIPLGESDHKSSGHFDDQAQKLFSRGKALRTYFLRPDELMKHVTSKKVLKPGKPD